MLLGQWSYPSISLFGLVAIELWAVKPGEIGEFYKTGHFSQKGHGQIKPNPHSQAMNGIISSSHLLDVPVESYDS
jgi:hypothetical protein